MKFIIVASGLM